MSKISITPTKLAIFIIESENMNWIYDDDPPENIDHSRYVYVSRIYGLDEQEFTETQGQELDRIFQQLPGFPDSLPKGAAIWFTSDELDPENDEPEPPYLWASFEPPGLQVVGELLPEQWAEWDTMFRLLVNDLPKKEVKFISPKEARTRAGGKLPLWIVHLKNLLGIH